ncbi:GNAT family N-acetyltransferase [Leisingera sp. McT4-56]|uniref:GNAT family N-acetyltransferase n=1 Tax=Leisingera sp. McT4-56 TaxID=2881255 RepID=UPI001CF854C8|nr:GNAT family N-acetyltransferase [Leisingera sp. McT4-56]MCB4456245.1 GNAT family N-acetyltransferase [Leisingera sp. McT4-56]
MSLSIAVTEDLKTCFALRHQVFVEEQGVPVEEEQDALDAAATHLLALQDGVPVGTARIVFNGNTAKIGRVCVLSSTRGTGLGAKLIEAAVDAARARPGITKAKLGAQIHALGFYEKLGFTAFGPVYDDAGIDHRDMVRDFT